MAEPASRCMNLEEFLRWDDGTDTHYELIRGADATLFLTSVDRQIAMSEL